MAEAGHLAVQHAFQPPEHGLNAPARAIQLSDLPGADLCGQVAPQPDHGLAAFGGRIQCELDAPPGRLAFGPGRLLADLAGSGTATPFAQPDGDIGRARA